MTRSHEWVSFLLPNFTNVHGVYVETQNGSILGLGELCDQPVSALDSFNRVVINSASTISPVRTSSGMVIEPVVGDLNRSIPTMKAMPETYPANSSKPFEVPSGAG